MKNESFPYRDVCPNCRRIVSLCLCSKVRPFSITPKIVLLIHPNEFKKTVGTARLVHLSIRDSGLWRGYGRDFDTDPRVLAVLKDPSLHPMVLFPGEDSLNLSTETPEAIQEKIPAARKLVFFVIDGTWGSARQILRESKLLQTLPKVSFHVTEPSRYEFRKQPKQFCLSTLEAVHVLIQNLIEKKLCAAPEGDAHHHLPVLFQHLVRSQLDFENDPANRQRYLRNLRTPTSSK